MGIRISSQQILKVLYVIVWVIFLGLCVDAGSIFFTAVYASVMLSDWGVKYAEWLGTQGVEMPDTASLSLGGADVWLFMAAVLFVIAQIFKKGIEIQSENELTV